MAFDKSKETKEQRKARKAQYRAEQEGRQHVASGNAPEINVLCVRFGNKYGQEYVVKLRNMVERHLNVPYKFWCLTDDPAPLQGVHSIVRPNRGYAKGKADM